MGLGEDTDERRVRGSSSLASMLAASMIAVGVGGCGGSSDDPTSTATAPVESSTTTTPAQGSPPDAADYLGATLTSATAGEPGVVVQSVEPDSKSRLKRGDVIVAFNGTAVASPGGLSKAIGTPEVGGQVTIRVVRGSHRITLTEVQSPTAYLGANVKDTTGSPKGAEVVAIAPESPAAHVAIRRGDVITELDGAAVNDSNAFRNHIASTAPGTEVTLTVLRDNREQKIRATLGEFKADATEPEEGRDSGPGATGQGKLGLTVIPLTPDIATELKLPAGTTGVVIESVDPAGPGASAGLARGDLIQEVNRQVIRSAADLSAAIDKNGAKPALILINRRGDTIYVTIRPRG